LKPVPNKSHTKIPSILDATMNQVQLGWILKNFTKNYNRVHLPNGGCYGQCPFFIYHPNSKTWHLHYSFSSDGTTNFILNLHVSFPHNYCNACFGESQYLSRVVVHFEFLSICHVLHHWALSLAKVSMCNITTSFLINHMTSTSIWWTLEMEAW